MVLIPAAVLSKSDIKLASKILILATLKQSMPLQDALLLSARSSVKNGINGCNTFKLFSSISIAFAKVMSI
jgi:hypothetical protein